LIIKTILKLIEHDDKEEILFELNYLLSLSIAERFQLTFRRNKELLSLLENNGHRKPAEIIKRA
jgi:hypothetical protein